MIQVAWSGGRYRRAKKAEMPPVRWLNRVSPEAEKQQEKQEEDTVLTTIIRTMSHYLNELDWVTAQRKPWPDPLPKYLPLNMPIDASYMIPQHQHLLKNGYKDRANHILALNDAISHWQQGEGEAIWKSFTWDTSDSHLKPLETAIGLIDHPRKAQQRAYVLSLAENNVAIFGAPGSGRTTFMRTVITGLVTTHPPEALHIYILDFGGRNLELFLDLPHVGAVITQNETERFTRLIRYLENTIQERTRLFSQKRVDTLADYNRQLGIDPLPAHLLMIDNFAEIKENHETLIPSITTLLREGRQVGIHIIASGDLPNSMGSKVYNLFEERLALRLIDQSEYSSVVGRTTSIPGEIAGRGLVSLDRNISNTPLEIQIAAPVALPPESLFEMIGGQAELTQETYQVIPLIGEEKVVERLASSNTLLPNLIEQICQTEHYLGDSYLPKPIETLDEYIFYPELEESAAYTTGSGIHALLGIEDNNLSPLWISLKDTPHFVITGPPLSGISNLIQTWILSLAKRYSPQEVSIVIVDAQRRLVNHRGKMLLDMIPHVLAHVSEPAEMRDFVKKLVAEFKHPREENDPDRPEIFVFIDNYDDIEDIAGRGDRADWLKTLAQLARSYGADGLHFILGGSLDVTKSQDDLRKQVNRSRFGFALRAGDGVTALNGKVPHALRNTELAVGRGFLVRSGQVTLAQTATFEPAEISAYADLLDSEINMLRNEYTEDQRYKWLYDEKGLADQEEDTSQEAADSPVQSGEPRVPSLSSGTFSEPELPDIEQQKAAREAVNEENPYREILTGETLRKLTPDLLNQINLTAPVPAEEIPLQMARTIEGWITRGAVHLPDTLSNELIQQIEKRVAIYDLLEPRRLRMLPDDLLAEAGVSIGQLDRKKLISLTNAQISEAVARQWIKLPSMIADDLVERINHRVGIYELLPARDIVRLGKELIQEFGLSPSDIAPEELYKTDVDELQSRIDLGEILLPDSLSADQERKIRRRVAFHAQLQARKLVQLPLDLLQEINLKMNGFTAEQIVGADPNVIQEMIDTDQIGLPDTLTKEMVSKVNQSLLSNSQEQNE